MERSLPGRSGHRLQPPERLVSEKQVGRSRSRRQVDVASNQHGERAPDQQRDNHDSCNLHDAERLATRFVDALDVAPPKVDGHQHTKADGEQIRVQVVRLAKFFEQLIDQMAEIQTCRNHTDGAGENVVEHQRGHRQPRHERPHRIPHNDIDPAAHEHAGTFHVNRADGVAEQHDAEHIPCGRRTDRLFRDTAGIKRR